MKWVKNSSGFTIVELLIVIVVIAILAAITIVSYNGISQRAKASGLQNDLNSAVKKIETTKISGGLGVYPSSINGMGLSPYVAYFYSATTNSYCVEIRESVQAGSPVYSATNGNSIIVDKPCSQNGLLAWWKLNNNGNDSGPLGLNGTVTNATGTSNHGGFANQALSFSSASQSYVQIAANPAITAPKSFGFWVRPTSWASPTASTILANRNNSSTGFFIAYIAVSDVLNIDCGFSSGGNRWPTNYKPTLNQWSHIVVTCANEDGLKLYVNGVLQDQDPTVDTSAMSLSTSNMRIGRDSTTNEMYFNGGIDDVRLFDRVLTPGEATLLYTENAQ